MTYSLSPHRILTEPSPETMSGKGREGNKEGKGREFGWLPRPRPTQVRAATTRRPQMVLPVIGLGSKP